MKKVILFLLCILLLATCVSLTVFADVPDASYQMLFHDEFEGNALDTTKWGYRTGGTNRTENIRVSDGKLLIDYKKIDDNQTSSSYTGGGVITKENFPFGYYETKAKVFTGVKGLHTSFWTATENFGVPYYPQSNHLMEIDGFEFNSRSDGIAPEPAYNLHYWWGNGKNHGGATYSNDTDGDKTTNDEFVMGFEVLPGKVIYYCNGVEVGSYNTTIYSPENVWFTALAYYGIKSPDDIDDTKADENGLFGSSEYDYFRYYQKKLKGVNLLANPHFEFNRQTANTARPRSFYTTGSVTVNKTPFAHNGFCSAVILKNSTMGRNFPFLIGGNYTFEGYFKTSDNAVARLVAYDKDGNELKSAAIPTSSAWAKTSMTDIAVVDSAYVVVEVTEGTVMADDLAFYAQDGETGYETYKDSDYENYTAVKSAESASIILDADDAEKSSNTWTSSTATGQSNLYAAVTTSNYESAYATWTHTFEKAGVYDLNAYQIIWDNNVPTQSYTVALDGKTVLNSKSFTTKSGSTQAGAWEDLCTVSVTAGQTMTITLKPGKPERGIVDVIMGREGWAYMRISPIQILSHDALLIETALVAQINNPFFQHQCTPYAFDEKNGALFPYKKDGEFYIPYQAIKSFVPVSGVEDTATYVTTTQIENGTDYNVYSQDSYIIIYENKYTASDGFVPYAKSVLDQYSDRLMFIEGTAAYVGKTNLAHQTVWDSSTIMLSDGWGNSSLGYGSSSKYGTSSANATWLFYPTVSGKYSIQIYNIVHQGSGNAGPSTTAAGVHLSINGRTHTYTLDQYAGETGWHDLGTFEMDANITTSIFLYNAAGSGILRANAIRLVPVFDTPTYFSALDKDNQEFYSYTTATQSSTFTEAENGIGYSENTNASLSFTATPALEQEYRIQIYAPAANEAATTGAKVVLNVGDTAEYFLLNQKNTAKAGWYELGIFNLKTTDTVNVSVSNFAGDGALYARGIRLIPAYEAPTFVNDAAVMNQELYDRTVAQKTGAWQESGGVYIGCCTAPPTAENKDAAISWTVNPQRNLRYSVQVYVPKQTASGAKDATVALDINGNLNYYTVCQRADSEENTGTGWYDLGVYDLTTSDTVNITLTNRTLDGWLRAKAIRLVPVAESVTYANNTEYLYQKRFGLDTAETVGTWTAGKDEYADCIAAEYSNANADASVTWTVTPETSQNYAVQIYLPKLSDNATSAAGILLKINDSYCYYTADQRADSYGAGWYTLGSYDLTTEDTVSVTLTNHGQESVLYAKAIRLLPNAPDAVQIADFNEPNQELWNFQSATTIGNWTQSGGAPLSGCYYGEGDATVTWTPVPKKTQKYSIQIYVPCFEVSSTTQYGYVDLSIDGAICRYYIDQQKDPYTYMGWYDLGVFDLNPDSDITIEMGKTAGTYIRAKAVRFIPYPFCAATTQNGTAVTAKIGTLSRYQDSFLFAEYNSDGILQSITEMDTAPTVDLTLTDASNKYQLFFWNDNFKPAALNAGSK